MAHGSRGRSDQKFVCCNFDEGDSGTFADRMVVEGDPFTLIEGMTIAAHAVGATEGYVYIRSEYPHAVATLRRAVDLAYTQGFLGDDVLGCGLRFDLHIRVGAGAYICGEESSMLDSLEGKRGEVRAKPPIPAIGPVGPADGRQQRADPVRVRWSADGGAAYAELGTGRSRGTQVFQLAGNIKQGGIVELPFGVTLRELVEEYGGGTRSGRPVRAVQVGGPLGAYVPPTSSTCRWTTKSSPSSARCSATAASWSSTTPWTWPGWPASRSSSAPRSRAGSARRAGSAPPRRGSDGRIIAARTRSGRSTELVLLDDLCETMTKGSLCAMGGLTPMPVQSAIKHWPEDFEREGADNGAQNIRDPELDFGTPAAQAVEPCGSPSTATRSMSPPVRP